MAADKKDADPQTFRKNMRTDNMQKRRAAQFGFGWSNSRAEISVLEWFREEKTLFSLLHQIWLATFSTDSSFP